MTTTQINTAELTGAALDWATAEAIDAERIKINSDGRTLTADLGSELRCSWSPSSDWEECGPLIRKHHVMLESDMAEPMPEWICYAPTRMATWVTGFGNSPQIAICRAIVAAELGDTVHVPTELVEGGV